MPAPRRSAVLSAVAALLLALAGPATEAADYRHLFFDEDDRQVDVSELLARGGFLPMPIIITEPAVDQGLGIAAYFVRNPPPGSRLPPTRTIAGAARTGNGSEGFGFLRTGSFADGRILYNVALAKGLAVLDFYPGNRDFALTYNNDIFFAGLGARYRFGDGGFSAGTFLNYRRNEISVDTGGALPRLDALDGQRIDLPSLGFDLHFDSRDNPLSPKEGMNLIGKVQIFDDAIGSDADFTSTSLFGTWFHTRQSWTLALMGDYRASSSGTPFFMEPDVNIRGLERSRYRGDQVFSGEAELTRRITPRWAALGFVGYGRTFDGGEADIDTVTYGGGVRYRIAKKLGLDVGLDLGFGPDEEVVYLQFGHAWGHQMD